MFICITASTQKNGVAEHLSADPEVGLYGIIRMMYCNNLGMKKRRRFLPSGVFHASALHFIGLLYKNCPVCVYWGNYVFSIFNPYFPPENEGGVKIIRYPESLTLYFKPMPTKKLRDNVAVRETSEVYKYAGMQVCRYTGI